MSITKAHNEEDDLGKKNTECASLASLRILEEDIQISYYYPKACKQSKFYITNNWPDYKNK